MHVFSSPLGWERFHGPGHLVPKAPGRISGFPGRKVSLGVRNTDHYLPKRIRTHRLNFPLLQNCRGQTMVLKNVQTYYAVNKGQFCENRLRIYLLTHSLFYAATALFENLTFSFLPPFTNSCDKACQAFMYALPKKKRVKNDKNR